MATIVKEDLLGAGCGEEDAAAVERLCQSGELAGALHELKVLRCGLMEELHQSQRRVDCLDYLIRQTEKEIKATKERR